ncbi:MAG: NUDIX hydrolase [Oceanobacter sp.]
MLLHLLIGFVILPALVISASSLALPPAGVIPYSCQNGEALVLLAYDNGKDRNGWAAFGGGADKGESIAQTAAREFHEETGCVFPVPDAQDLEPLESSAIGTFHTYVYEVPFVDSAKIEASRCGTVGERKDWIWFRLTDLITALKEREDIPDRFDSSKTYPLWFIGRVSLQEARDDGILPQDNSVCQK